MCEADGVYSVKRRAASLIENGRECGAARVQNALPAATPLMSTTVNEKSWSKSGFNNRAPGMNVSKTYEAWCFASTGKPSSKTTSAYTVAPYSASNRSCVLCE